MAFALAREELGLLAEQSGDVDRLTQELELALLEPARVEEIVDQRAEPARLRIDDPEVAVLRLVVEVARQQEAREAQLARLTGAALLEALLEVALGEPCRRIRDLTHRPRDRPCEVDAEREHRGSD